MEIVNIQNKNISIKVAEAPIDTDIKMKSIIKFWQRQQALNEELDNGDAFLSFEGNYELFEDTYEIQVYQTEYMNYLYNLKMENGSRSIMSTTIIVTEDDYLVFGKEKPSFPKEMLHFIGGAYDIADIVGQEINPQKAIERMLFEQMPIRYSDVKTLHPLLLVQESTGAVNIVYVTKVVISKNDLEEAYARMKIKEFNDLMFLTLEPKAVIEFTLSEEVHAPYVKPSIERFYKSLIIKE